MTFTALHRAAGVGPGPITDELLDAAIKAQATERDDLDWKAKLPDPKGIPNSDFPKDVAAIANAGGGVIVFGVLEEEKAATERVDVGLLTEVHERSLRSAAVTAITPPVLNLVIHKLLDSDRRAVVVEVPTSVDGPHLIYRGEYFGAPVRNDSDTVWMRERQIETMYRARFDERRRATEALDRLYVDAAAGRDTAARAWLIGVAHPRVPRVGERMTRRQAQEIMSQTEGLALLYAGRAGIHPLENVDRYNPRPGLRRWVAVNTATDDSSRWKESWITLHHDGSVTVASAIGAHRSGFDTYRAGHEVEARSVECAVADLMALTRMAGDVCGRDEYELRVGIEWAGSGPLMILSTDPLGYTSAAGAVPLHRFAPVEMTVNRSEADGDYFWHVHDLALDCVNQGGVTEVELVKPPTRQDGE